MASRHRSRAATVALVLLAVLLAASACRGRPTPVTTSDTGVGDAASDGSVHFFHAGRVPLVADVLLVVDPQSALLRDAAARQRTVKQLLGAMRNRTLGSDGTGKPCNSATRAGCNLPDLRIGVITSDLGVGNANTPGCTVGGDNAVLGKGAGDGKCSLPRERWLAYDPRTGRANLAGGGGGDAIQALGDTLQCMLGDAARDGCAFSQPLEAARRALDPALSINPGFLRDHAFLLLLFISEQDDCSAADAALFDAARTELGPLTPFRCFEYGVRCDVADARQIGPRRQCVPQGGLLHDVQTRYVEFLRGVKPPGRMLVAVVAGPTARVEVGRDDAGRPALASSCTGDTAGPTPAIRLYAVAQTFETDGQLVSACDGDVEPAVETLGNKVLAGEGQPCLTSPPLTADGALACSAGQGLAPGVTCSRDCLADARCEVVTVETPSAWPAHDQALTRCPAALFNSTSNDCGATCPCWRLRAASNKTFGCGPQGSVIDVLRAPDDPWGGLFAITCRSSALSYGDQRLASEPQCVAR